MDIITHSLLPFLAILVLLLVVHEGGHYIAAKLLGVTVLEAGFGLPPRVWATTWRGTEYSFNALPFGAFVRMLGEEDPTDPKSLAAQPKWKRSVILGAGVVMNLLLAITLFTVAAMIPHKVSIGGAAIADVIPNSPAAQADLRTGDQILKVNGRKVENTSDASYLLQLNRGSHIDVTVARKDPRTGATGTDVKNVYSRWDPPTYVDDCGVEQSSGPIGIAIGPAHTLNTTTTAAERAKLENQAKQDFAAYREKLPADAPASCFAGTKFFFAPLSEAKCSALDSAAQDQARALKNEVAPTISDPCLEFRPPLNFTVPSETRHEAPWTAIPHATRKAFESVILARNQIWTLLRGFNNSSPLTGPVGIAQATGEVVNQAGWLSLIEFAALISMSLALLNILPLPMVDGGRLMFVLIELLRRGKRVPPEKEALVHFAGFVAMAIAALVITYFDVARIVSGGSLLK